MAKNIIYLVRHGQTFFNLEDRLGGDPELTQEGLMHAEKTAGYLAEIELGVAYSSNLKRAVKTAEIILRYHSDTHFLIAPELAEIRHGDMDSMTNTEFRERFPDMYEARERDKYNWAFPSGESYRTLKQRILPIWETVKTEDGNSVIVGHQATNRIILGHFLGLSEEEITHMKIPNDVIFGIDLDSSNVFHINGGERSNGYKVE